MAEDQGVNGDLWNDQATELLRALNWETIGDANIDLPNEQGGFHGMDRMFKYAEAFSATNNEGVLVEAKRYKTDSFKASVLDEWVKTLDKKLTNIKHSNDFHETYPYFAQTPLRTGIIMIWFHNIYEYITYKSKFKDALKNVKLHKKGATPNKIYVFDNDTIVRLASLHLSVEKINSTINRKLKFYYPSTGINPVHRSEVLNPNYMVSKFILAEFIDNNGIENRVVFYYGALTIKSFTRLKYALGNFGFIDDDKPLWLYTYLRDDEQYRKIKPEVSKLFNTEDQKVNLKEMELFIELPTFMRKDD